MSIVADTNAGATGTAPGVDHVLVIMTDQQRADLSAREGFAVDCTPTLDALARDGRWFDRAYTAAPLCVPARVSMLTGRFPSATGVRENHGFDRPHHAGDLMELAAAAGHRTAVIGKNHSHLTPERVDHFSGYGHFGHQPPLTDDSPAARFDAWLKDLGARVATEPAPFDVEAQIPSRLVDETIAWLDRDAGPSTTWLSFPEPHVPYQVPEPYFSQYTPETVPPPRTGPYDAAAMGLPWQWVRRLGDHLGDSVPETLARARANYVGMLRLIDDQVARLLDHLRSTGRLERTLIICLSDHGEFAGEYGLLRKGPELPEVLTRIPMSFTGPGIPAAADAAAAHVSIVDVLPTICELLGWPVPVGVQGRSMVEVLRGDPPAGEFDSVYAEQGVGGLPMTDPAVLERVGEGGTGDVVATLCDVTQDGAMRMIRSGRWKLLVPVTGSPRLYDLQSDPYELTDRYGEPELAATALDLMGHLARWTIRADDPLPIPDGGHPRQRHPRNYYWADEPGGDPG